VVDIANAGNQPATVTGVGPLPGPFAARYPVTRGLVLNAGDDLAIRITFRPARRGQFTGAYRLTWTDRFGRHAVVVPLKGAGA
jgi:hypothetical protein